MLSVSETFKQRAIEWSAIGLKATMLTLWCENTGEDKRYIKEHDLLQSNDDQTSSYWVIKDHLLVMLRGLQAKGHSAAQTNRSLATNWPGTSTSLPNDNRTVVPPDPISNSEVKRSIADGSVGLPHVRVGHCWAFIPKNLDQQWSGFFIACGLVGVTCWKITRKFIDDTPWISIIRPTSRAKHPALSQKASTWSCFIKVWNITEIKHWRKEKSLYNSRSLEGASKQKCRLKLQVIVSRLTVWKGLKRSSKNKLTARFESV